ncbi:MAG: DUF86 domain-containing protein [Deltaproteobacteria bacterium]|nr:DUF86 domain-containing protein [Deltaproteobacteria bacterium]MBN2672117.1 DUF86 domain-containing protein [Deltaproteobacteria bacterium]
MDIDLIHSKIDSLHRCIARIESKVPSSAEVLRADLDRQDIIILNLERAIQQSVDIAMHIISQLSEAPTASSMGDAFSVLQQQGIIADSTTNRMKKAVGFRNTAVHAYQQIDVNIIYAIITRHLDDFRTFAKEMVVYLEQ